MAEDVPETVTKYITTENQLSRKKNLSLAKTPDKCPFHLHFFLFSSFNYGLLLHSQTLRKGLKDPNCRPWASCLLNFFFDEING